MTFSNDVLIVGAGPTGLTLAIDLARRGISFRLIDAAPGPLQGSRGKGILPRTLEVFNDLGIVTAILTAGSAYPKFRIHLGPVSFGKKSLAPWKAPTSDTPFPNLWMAPQFSTETIMRDRLAEFGHAPEYGVALLNFTQDDDGVIADLGNGESIRVKYLVGADGGRSTVRRTLGLRLAGEGLGDEAMMVADVQVSGLSRQEWHIWPLSKGGMVGLCPMPSTDLFQLMAPAEFGANGLAAAIEKITRCRVVSVPWQSQYKLSVRMLERYRVGRVFLGGDAAHVHPPVGGQGLNTGVQDAYNLGWKLAAVLEGADDSLLDTYQAERLPVAAGILGLSKELLRNKSAKRGKDTTQLSISYPDSPLSTGVAWGNLRPGDRMPDAPLTDGRRLFDAMRGPHGIRVRTQDGYAISVRPDGYVGNIGMGEDVGVAGVEEVSLAGRI